MLKTSNLSVWRGTAARQLCSELFFLLLIGKVLVAKILLYIQIDFDSNYISKMKCCHGENPISFCRFSRLHCCYMLCLKLL